VAATWIANIFARWRHWRGSRHDSFIWRSQILYKLAYSRKICIIIFIISLYQ